MMEDIMEKLADLELQAKTENSHYYVANTCREAMIEIAALKLAIAKITVKNIA